MNKIRKVAAIIAVILLAGMYVLTLISAIFDNSNTMALFKASLYSTVIIPFMLYVFILVTKLVKGRSEDDAKKYYAGQSSDDTDSEA
ncbi:MAG: hypothetical protein IJM37_00815 [Lachnospiraceae bacterium]|nr:hypothetical protein [Lachnospiraceae bacterium]